MGWRQAGFGQKRKYIALEWLPGSSRQHPPVILFPTMNEPSKGAKFEVRAVLRTRLPRGPSIIFAGRIVEGTIRPGMDVLFELQPALYCSARITAVEFIDRVSSTIVQVNQPTV
jgi:hypothetical protein